MGYQTLGELPPYPGRCIEVLHPRQKIEDASGPMNRQQDDHKELHNLQG